MWLIWNDTLNCIIKLQKGNDANYFQKSTGYCRNFVVETAKMDFIKKNIFTELFQISVIQGGCPRGDGYGGLNYTYTDWD